MTKRQIPAGIKKAVLIRDNSECQICGWTENLEYHHIYEWKNENAHSVWNLMLISGDCHKLITPRRFVFPVFEQQVIDQFVEILRRDQPVRTKLAKLKKWISQRPIPKRDINRIMIYLEKVVNSKYHVLELSYYKKHSGILILKWDVSLSKKGQELL